MKAVTMRVLGVRVDYGAAGYSFILLIRRQSVFAVSEICKGALIFGIGDMATADQFGEAVVIACQTVGCYGLAFMAR
jgi:hypothetical protein